MNIRELKDLMCIPADAGKEDIEEIFKKVAYVLLLQSKITIGNNISYTIEEIEFYYFKNDCFNEPIYSCTYPRDCKACDFFFHYSGVDICFESTDESFGGVLIRSLKKEGESGVIGGPLRCANELANTSYNEGNKIELNVYKEKVKDATMQEPTIRQGIKADYEIKDKKVFPKVKYCYYIAQGEGQWNRTRRGVYKLIKGTKDFDPTKEVTDRYHDNPENRIKNLESELNQS